MSFPVGLTITGILAPVSTLASSMKWVTGVGLMRSDYGTHSLRRTKASIIYRATGNLRAVQILLGHSKIENTVRYLGIDVEDALALAREYRNLTNRLLAFGEGPTSRRLELSCRS